jgi:cysteine desulfurase
MLPFLRDQYANPSSIHQFGQAARHAIETAREQVAELIRAQAKEIVFTSGGTESINLAIRGGLALRPDRREIVTTQVEHSAVLNVCEQLEREGYTAHSVGVDRNGAIREDEWEASLTDRVALASIMHANNETGVMSDVAKLAGVAANRGIPVHVDAVQSAGKVPIDVTSWPAPLVSLAAHKFHGPKGVGALYVRRRTRLAPMILGGSQERQLRGGTEDVAGIVGMGVAASAALRDGSTTMVKVGGLRDALEAGIVSRITFAHVNGRNAERIHNTTNISFEGLSTEAILILLSEAGVCVSSGAACSSGSLEPSHVLKAMGLSDAIRHGAIRFSLSRFNTRDEIETVLTLLPELLSRLTSLLPNR